MSVSGKPVFDTIKIGRIEADFLKPQIHLKGIAGFVNTSTGLTHGWTEGTGAMWSSKTHEKLEELKQCMEMDLASKHFDGAVRGSKRDKGIDLSGGVGGLGEYLEDQDVPSV